MRIRLGRRKVWSPIRDTLCFRAGEPPASAPRVNVPKEQENQNQASKILTCAKPPAPALGGAPTARGSECHLPSDFCIGCNSKPTLNWGRRGLGHQLSPHQGRAVQGTCPSPPGSLSGRGRSTQDPATRTRAARREHWALTGRSFGVRMSSSRQSTSKTRDCCPVRLRALGVIPETMDTMRFCMWFCLARAWGKTGPGQFSPSHERRRPQEQWGQSPWPLCPPRACLVLAAGISEPGDAGGCEEQVESHGQEGQVAHQLEALPVQHGPAQHVGEAQPLQGQAHRAQTGVPQLHVQEVVVQTLQG